MRLFLLLAAASVLAPLRAGASQFGVSDSRTYFFSNDPPNQVFREMGGACGLEKAGGEAASAAWGIGPRSIAISFSASSATVGWSTCLAHTSHALPCMIHSSTLAQPARGTERSEYRTRQLSKRGVA